MNTLWAILGASVVSANLYCNSRTSVLGRLRDYLWLLIKLSVLRTTGCPYIFFAGQSSQLARLESSNKHARKRILYHKHSVYHLCWFKLFFSSSLNNPYLTALHTAGFLYIYIILHLNCEKVYKKVLPNKGCSEYVQYIFFCFITNNIGYHHVIRNAINFS